jgi:hypothetical protein
MAKVKGIISLRGTIDGLNFYERLGKPVVRKAGGGFNGEAIKKKDSMERVRENASEFGMSSRLKSQFQRSLWFFYRGIKDGTLHGRLMRLFMDLKDVDPVSVRGGRRVYRGLETAPGLELLRRFVYTPQCRVGDKLGADFSMDWDLLQLRIEVTGPGEVYFPEGATHLELSCAVVEFDFEHHTYIVTQADSLQVARGEMPVEHSFALPALSGEPGVKLAFLGLRYYEEVAGLRYYYKGVTGIGLEQVSVKA